MEEDGFVVNEELAEKAEILTIQLDVSVSMIIRKPQVHGARDASLTVAWAPSTSQMV